MGLNDADLKEKIVPSLGGVSGGVSVAGSSFSVCHTVCTGVVSVLSIFGVAITGMPLQFLQTYAIYFWVVAVLLFAVSAYFYFKHRMISTELLLFNIGAIIAGTPFIEIHPYHTLFWTIGGLIIVAALLLFAKKKFEDGKTKKASCCKV